MNTPALVLGMLFQEQGLKSLHTENSEHHKKLNWPFSEQTAHNEATRYQFV